MTSAQVTSWLERYRQAWEARDPEAAAALFSDRIRYYETPFGPPAQGKDGVRTYWAAATRHQTNITFAHEVIAITGNVGVARWWAEYTKATSGVRARLDGIFVLEFDDDGRCQTLREWWHRTELASPHTA